MPYSQRKNRTLFITHIMTKKSRFCVTLSVFKRGHWIGGLQYILFCAQYSMYCIKIMNMSKNYCCVSVSCKSPAQTFSLEKKCWWVLMDILLAPPPHTPPPPQPHSWLQLPSCHRALRCWEVQPSWNSTIFQCLILT